MLSPAYLLLIERLIEILMAIVRAIDLAADGKPDLRQAGARLLLSRMATQLTRLRERNLAVEPERDPASPIRLPSAPAGRPIQARPARRAPRYTEIARRTARLDPRRSPLRSKADPALRHSHA